jgi:SET domain-containing protein
MTHDCTPNCAIYIGKDLTTTFKTIRKVEAGQLLSINYIMLDRHTKPVNERWILFHQMLMKSGCGCKRCHSSDEDGTYLSAIKCPADKKRGGERRECQYLLPMFNPSYTMGTRDIFVWKCKCSHCTGATRQVDVKH